MTGRKPILTLCWNSFFDLLFVAFVVIRNGLPQRILPLCLTVKVPLSTTLSPVDGRKEATDTTPCLRLAILGGICKVNGFFVSLLPLISDP